MMQYKKMIMAFATLVVVTTILVAAPYANAQTTNAPAQGGFFQGLITFIEQKFGLDKTQVQSAVKEYSTARKATITPRPTMSPQQQADREKTRLDQLVKSGKITTDQETAIIAELSALRTKYNMGTGASPSETPEQRKTNMQSFQTDLKTWAKAQNINLASIMPGFGEGFGEMRRNNDKSPMGKGMEFREKHGGFQRNPSGTPSAVPTQ